MTGALGLAACGSSTTASSSSTTSSSADASSASTTSFDGNFVLGFDQDFPPYGYVGNDGSYTGFDIDLAQAVCDREGWTLVPTPISWDAKDTLLNSGQITCIWNGFTIEGREDGYAFTDPYMENRQVVVVPASSDVQQLSDLAGKNVITQADSAALDVLSEGGSQEELGKSFGNLQTIDNYNTAFMMLESGQVDAIAIDYPVAVFNIGDKTSEFRILDENLNSEHFGVGFANTDDGAQLAKTVEADLQVLDSEGTVKELCEKYADQGVSYDLWCLPKA
ncbi:ABC transporter substrate-binding protein [Tractidigestivibacter scatoligenes]|uniref:ABC transporter substrate-binding protein n=1 Tax=Tractidigestivibacter scatoligenes TaxID=1299998 RepID=A0A100YW21_TRASO|nr:ABC transporter substrate-binding protein [Tractidigestivibacter scatoligenes]